MSKRESIARYNLIIKKLRKHPSSFVEISDYLELESEIQGYNYNISLRTFQRDLQDIRSIYNIDVQYDYSNKVYYIDFDEQPYVNERILEAFDVFNALNLTERLSNHIQFERRRPQGTEHLYGLLHAIKNQVMVKFIYQKYWDDEITNRKVKPYVLKEFKSRWYISAKDIKDNLVKSFALDRISELTITKQRFQLSNDFDVNEHFKHCFGIVNPIGQLPEEVELSFDPFQGKYIKSLPLHDSQTILNDNEKELRIRLNLLITHDFFMELLSYGDRVKVIKPISLLNQMKSTYESALGLYE